VTTIRVDRRGAVGRIMLTRADKQNAIDRETAELLFAGFQRLETDNQVRVVHLTGEGDDFCVGTDLDAMSRMVHEPAEVQRHDAES
jgi:enoyl-CoA hydratase/carnithine racemase